MNNERSEDFVHIAAILNAASQHIVFQRVGNSPELGHLHEMIRRALVIAQGRTDAACACISGKNKGSKQ